MTVARNGEGEDGDDPPALEFTVLEMRPLEPSAEPALSCSVGIDAAGRSLNALSLKINLRIRAELRRYADAEAARLWELFGPVEQWGRSLGPIPWTKLRHEVGPFAGSTTTELLVPCRFETGAAAPKYLDALEDGVAPLELLFGGTLSWTNTDTRLQTAMIPWDREASFRLPASVWRALERGR